MSKASFTLSQYQQAVLTEMGISLWSHAEHQHDAKPVDVETTTQQVSAASKADRIAALRQIQQPKKTELTSVETTPTETKQDVSGKYLMAFDKALSQVSIIRDVLVQLDADKDNILFVEPDSLDKYENYQLVWLMGEQVSYRNKVLTTPAIEQLNNATVKRQLWQQLSTR